MNSNSLKFLNLLLRIFLRREEYLEKSGDLEEVYSCLIEEVGPFRAKMWYWYQVLKVVPVSVMDSILWQFVMFNNYFKTTLRTMKQQKAYTFINVFGLAVGFACCMLIGLFVTYELSYDRFNVNADRIYRITKNDDVGTQVPLAKELPRLFPEVEYATGFANHRMQPVRYGDHLFYESPVLSATNDCFQMFSFRLLQGDRESVLVEPNTVVLTRSMAEKYFHNKDPLGKAITIGDLDYRVDGVMEDVPGNAHFDAWCPTARSSPRGLGRIAGVFIL
jgi:putative ABC transport system permease protein